MACLKTLLTIFSFIFVVIGIAILAFGAYARIKLLSYISLSTIDYSNAPWAMIAVGSFIAIVGIMGCCATIKGNTCLLRTYGFLLAVVFICELAGAIVAIVFKGKVFDGFKSGMSNAVEKYTTDDNLKSSVDKAQTELHCCGVTNYTDWWQSGNLPPNNVPMSCCSDSDWCKNHKAGEYVDIGTNTTAIDEKIYTKGCHAMVFNIVNGNLAIIIGTMFGVAFFQVIGIILACCLASTINSNKYELV